MNTKIVFDVINNFGCSLLIMKMYEIRCEEINNIDCLCGYVHI